jgi:Tol biopolymer transport system component
VRAATALAGVLVVLTAGSLPAAAEAVVPNTERVSLSGTGVQGNGDSPDVGGAEAPSISRHGRYVAFSSSASNLVLGDTNDLRDVFLRDRQTGSTLRYSVSSQGVQANGMSRNPSVSATGRYVAFYSDASNLVRRDTNARGDVFVHDRITGKTIRVSVRADGGQANRGGFDPAISGDGLHVAFVSTSWNLVSGDTNNRDDVFVRDLGGNTTERVSISSSGSQTTTAHQTGRPSISGDGRYVAFDSDASDLVDDEAPHGIANVFIRDRAIGTTQHVGFFKNQIGMDIRFIYGGTDPSISADGRYVSYDNEAEDVDGAPGRHVYLYDRVVDRTVRVTLTPDGERANGRSFRSSISADGRYVTFVSLASDLVSDDTDLEDVFRWERTTGVIQQMSVNNDGVGGDNESRAAAISGDGLHVAFGSWATNLVPGDTNGHGDTFVRNLG